jgi:hypothetical protein
MLEWDSFEVSLEFGVEDEIFKKIVEDDDT